ncbi:M14 family zinc carboxypeptidase [Nocardiopsis sp. RSe5-2]|uniref:M14 family zinc carboxypeptidase n=1 Tax=Nocardiopsis endophytica TaxID=3018445 RepID=A0ABT4U480_9ACTN|nr:M14 family zinc carboxypeptidase [Nocardiopsis endophytica]MDA2811757.1 M14 family zinc carboxypeptidase [Nocardiopsis endophytica]
MKRNWRIVTAVTAFALLSPALASPALADAPEAAGGPIDPRPSTEELRRHLDWIEKRSRGAVDVTTIGTTNQGRPIFNATVGTGPLRLMYVTQQHGNEPLGTPAALELLEDLGIRPGKDERAVLDRVTLSVVVRANPDGHELDQRYNHDPDADPEYGEPGVGYDPNRYHSPSLAPEDNPVPEAAAVRRQYDAFDPHLVVDYHMQGRYIDDDGEEITASLMWPTAPGVDDGARDLSRQAVAVSAEAMEDSYDGANVSLYPGGDYEGIARNAYGLMGSGSVLVELSATGPDMEQAQIASAYDSMDGLARSAADGSLFEVDPDSADDIPERGDPLPAGQQGQAQPFQVEGDDLD